MNVIRTTWSKAYADNFDSIFRKPATTVPECGPDEIADGFGSVWSKTCPTCRQPTMFVVRPGKVQCANCE